MTMVCLSVSHRVTPVELLERLAVTTEAGDLLARLHAAPGIDEALVLSTCNRVEVYAAAHGPTRQVIRTLADQLGAHRGVRGSDVRRTARVRTGAAVAEHLFSVACGLDSMAVGEEQIVSQVKDAARAAAAAGSTGPVLTGLVDAALRTSKRARTETRIGTEGVSLVRAGLDLAAVQLGGLAGRDAVVLGTGSTGRLTARLLRAAGIGRVSVAGRSANRAAEVAAAVDGTRLRVEEVPGRLAETDILVTATGAAAPLVRAAAVRAARPQAAARPLVVLDLGMPSDVDPAVGRLPGVTLIDLTALGRHLADRAAPNPVPRVRAIVAEEAHAYVERHQQTAAAPVVAALHQQIGQIAATELARLQDRLPDLNEQQRAETAVAVHRILRKVLYQPTTRAKELAAGPDGPAYLAALSTLFDLDVTIARPAVGSTVRW
jgi:glutamyl-tRNA reductase